MDRDAGGNGLGLKGPKHEIMIGCQQGDVAAPVEQTTDIENGDLGIAATCDDEIEIDGYVKDLDAQQAEIFLELLIGSQRLERDPHSIVICVSRATVVQENVGIAV